MAEEKLALSDFKNDTVVFTSGIENKAQQEVDDQGLPICHTAVKVTAKSVKFVKPHKVSAK